MTARRAAGAVFMLAAAALAAPGGAAWMEARTTRFVVLADDAPAAVTAIARRLERFDAGMRRLHALREAGDGGANPLTVYVVPDIAAVQALCRSGGNRRRDCLNVAGFYEGRATGSVAFMPARAGGGSPIDLKSETVLFHEYSHHLMLANYSGAYPAWFVEGFAELNATASLDETTGGFGRPANHRMAPLLLGAKLPIRQLLTGRPGALTPPQTEQLYARGWLLTHYLTFEKARAGQLEAYLVGLNAGRPNLDMAEEAFGDLDRLDADMNAYLRRRTLNYAVLPLPPVPDAAIAVRALAPGEAALMPVRLRSERGVDRATAAELATDARRRAASFPSDPGAQAVLANAEYDAGDDDAAEAAADRALAADPRHRGAMICKGKARLRRAAAAKADKAAFAEARRWFVKANRAMPDDAEPLVLFYTAYLAAGETPPANAVEGLARAFELAPQDERLRMLMAYQLIRDRRLKEARGVLMPLAFSPHRPPDNVAARLVARIDQGEAVAPPDDPARDAESRD